MKQINLQIAYESLNFISLHCLIWVFSVFLMSIKLISEWKVNIFHFIQHPTFIFHCWKQKRAFQAMCNLIYSNKILLLLQTFDYYFETRREKKLLKENYYYAYTLELYKIGMIHVMSAPPPISPYAHNNKEI